jgi:putative ABC transport system permease protein
VYLQERIQLLYYPHFYRFKLFKNATYDSGNSRASFLRKALIVFQFTFAQVLILGTLVIGWQIRYVLNKDLGFTKDAVIYFHTPWYDKKGKTLLLKTELESLSEVSNISLSGLSTIGQRLELSIC